MVSIYNRVLNAIKNLVKEYWNIRKSLQNLVKGQERNTAQLAKIDTVVNQ